ncbi:MAG: NAD(P)H-dependent oxidoreductase [Saprospiraceae bacterium]|nr:NAD(P)H-dependent oxidoreductase [Saprospiraceae bacterium]
MSEQPHPGAVRGVVILGSARSDGNTRIVVDAFVARTGFDIIDLNDYRIGFFDYNLPDRQDDFIPLVQQLLAYDVLVFATPVYWYAMSAIMKNFFDRITDLLKWHKPLGRQLRCKATALISCGSDDDTDVAFTIPFVNSAAYLGMRYQGYVHTWVEAGAVPELVHERLANFAREVVKLS